MKGLVAGDLASVTGRGYPNFSEELMIQSEEYKFKSICDSQLVKNVHKSALEGKLADTEPLCALLGRIASGNQSNHLAFEWYQAELFPAR